MLSHSAPELLQEYRCTTVTPLRKNRFLTFLAPPDGSLRWQVFERTLLIAVVLDLALGGNGYLIKIGQFRLREILYVFCLAWAALRLTTIEPIRPDAKLLGWCGLLVAVTAFDTVLGYFGGSRVEAILAELKPLSYFPMVLFFHVAIQRRNDLTLVAALLVLCGTLLASLYLLLMAAANAGLVGYSTIFESLRVSDEFIFRHNPSDFTQPFIGFFYKGVFYVCISALFLIFDPFKMTKILAAILVIAIALTLTRGLCLAVTVCVLAGILLSRDWKRTPLFLGQCGLLLMILFFAQQAEIRLEMRAATTSGRTDGSGASAQAGPAGPGNGNPNWTASSGIAGCSRGASCDVSYSSNFKLERPGDNDRMEDIKFIANQADLSMFAIGRGLGAVIRGRERIEMTYVEVLYKQGILGLAAWFLLFLYAFQLYLAVPAETKQFGLAFFLSGLFVFVVTAGNTFLTGSIGMGAVFISMSGLLVLAREAKPMQRSDWYGEQLGRVLRV
jgi:hypothetical protein